MRDFRDRRLRVDAWLRTLGIDDLHCVNPTYDGGGDLFGRDVQFLARPHGAAARCRIAPASSPTATR